MRDEKFVALSFLLGRHIKDCREKSTRDNEKTNECSPGLYGALALCRIGTSAILERYFEFRDRSEGRFNRYRHIELLYYQILRALRIMHFKMV